MARQVVTLRPDGEDGWERVPVVGTACELNDRDEDLRMEGRTAFTYPRLSAADVIAWSSALSQAWDWIETASPRLAREMKSGVRAIVPVRSPTPTAHASATFREAPGLIALSRSSDAGILAEALVHEYHHTKLNAVLDVEPLIVGPTYEPTYYSPWRDDPRPLLGILHGAYTFQAILSFWCDFVDAGLLVLSQERINQRMYIIERQVLAATDTLRVHAELTELGSALVDAIEDNVRELSPRLPRQDAATRLRLDARLHDHRQSWSIRNPREETRLPTIASSTPSTLPTPLAEARQHLGLPDPGRDPWPDFPARLLSAFLAPTDADAAAACATRLRGTEPGLDPMVDVCAGHAAYVAGEYSEAAFRYLHAATQAPQKIETWQFSSHALRRLGRRGDAQLLLLEMETLAATRAPRRAPPRGDLDQLVAFARTVT